MNVIWKHDNEVFRNLKAHVECANTCYNRRMNVHGTICYNVIKELVLLRKGPIGLSCFLVR